jgi:L-asparaginase/beta-aspartyl-peptidase (threonine type)
MFPFLHLLHNVGIQMPRQKVCAACIILEKKNMSTPHGDFAIVVHGGVGSPVDYQDGCEQAARRAVEEIGISGDALEAAMAAVTALEDDGRFNAGRGAALGLDGATVEMDASVMDTRGRLGAVACVQGIENPVLLARAVADTPHWFLAGEGANRFAAAIRHPTWNKISERQREEHQQILKELAGSAPAMPRVDNQAFMRFWNYQQPLTLPPSAACDTVGAVVRAPDGHFGVAVSTGGSAPCLMGRVGDSPIIGSGFYAGPHGAVAATGIGEHIVRHLLAYRVYSWIEDGMPLEQALKRGIDLFGTDISVGLIAVSRTEAGAWGNRDMPLAQLIKP